MVAADTSAWLDFSKAIESHACKLLESALLQNTLVIPYPVLFEVLSGPGITDEAYSGILKLPRLDILEGFWERASKTRRILLKRKIKVPAMDCLIAQNCMDHKVSLITCDRDFISFEKMGLKLFGVP